MKPPVKNGQTRITALAVYVTDATLDGTGTGAGAWYGFVISGDGVATAAFNVGANGDAFGVADDCVVTVTVLLPAADAKTVNGVL